MNLEEFMEDTATEKAVPHIEYMETVREWWADLNAIKEFLGMEEYEQAKGVWHDFPEPVRLLLWKAPTRGFGSVFDTWERDALKDGLKEKGSYR